MSPPLCLTASPRTSESGALARREDLAAHLAVGKIHRVHVEVDPAVPHGLIERCDVVHGVHRFRADEGFKDGEASGHKRIGEFLHCDDDITDSITGARLPEVEMEWFGLVVLPTTVNAAHCNQFHHLARTVFGSVKRLASASWWCRRVCMNYQCAFFDIISSVC